jgi:CubicO group peptidase (beta-lactamase class C family)
MRWNRILRGAAALAIATPFAAPLAAQDADPRVRQVDSIFAAFDKPGSPGASIAVIRDGRIILERGYGYASLEHGVRITPNTVFDIASVSKQFAGLAVAMLVDQGRINLWNDVRTYIPELHAFNPPITIQHLVHHTSGLRDWPATLAVAGWRFDDVISFDQIKRFAFAQRTLNFVPGAEYTYSNTGYNILAELVARVTGQSFRAWTDENLFRPLGMASSHVQDDHAMIVPGRAFGYTRSADTAWRAVTDNLTALGSSSIFSSAHDMAKWLINFDSARVGGVRAMELMRTRVPLNDGSVNNYAFGIAYGEYRGQPFFSHSGSWAGFVSFLSYVPAKRFGVVVLANAPNVPVQRATLGITDLYLGAELAAAPTPPVTLASAPAVAVPAAMLDRYVGTYRLGPGWYVRIRRDGDRLLTQATRESEFELSPRSEKEFWVQGYNAAMRFERDSLFFRNLKVPRMPSADAARGRPLSELAGRYESEELGTSYSIVVVDTTVTLRHWRHGDIPLRRAFGDDWTAQEFFARSVAFQRDRSGRDTGFLVNAGERMRDVAFVRAR